MAVVAERALFHSLLHSLTMSHPALIKQGRVMRRNNITQPQPVHDTCHVLRPAIGTAIGTAVGTAIRRAIRRAITERYRWP